MYMDMAEVYVDGACRNNGHNNPQGGCGVYWGPFHPMNWSEKLQGETQTNNRAELTAAIIGLSQAIRLGLRMVKIITDSRYVKEGITKWIVEWKQNNWKTAEKSAKKRRDVMNKDLWLWLDFMRSRLDVEWQWVEGHDIIEGNLRADDLAKRGISSERGEWQGYAKRLYAGNPIADTELCNKEAEVSPKEDNCKTEDNCKKCSSLCTDKDQSIQCQDCKGWVHYKCTKLPSYQLYLFETTQRRFTCEVCTSVEETVNTEHQDDNDPESEKSSEDSTDSKKDENNQRTEKHPSSHPNEDRPHIEISTNDCGKLNLNKDQIRDSTTSTNSEDLKSINVNKSISEELDSFKKSTVDMLQESFVSSFEKINNSIREMTASQADFEKLNQKIKKLTEENNELKCQMKSSQLSTSEEKYHTKTCSNCEESNKRATNLKKELDNEKEKSRQLIFRNRLEAEAKESKLTAEISLLHRKEESFNKLSAIQEADILAMEKRLDAKNKLILELEMKISDLTIKVTKLQDTIFETKCQSYCHAESFQPVMSKKKDDGHTTLSRTGETQKNAESPKETLTIEKQINLKNTEITEQANSQISARESKFSKDRQQDAKNEDNNLGRRKKVEIIGTSNIKYLSTAYIGEKEFHINKVLRYTIEQTKDYIDSMTTTDPPDVIVLHPLCNEIKDNTPDTCAQEVDSTVQTITDKFKDVKILLSLGLPRNDVALNRKIEKTNILIKEKMDEKYNVYLCDNANLFYRGGAQHGILQNDGLHLSNNGTKKLGRNLKAALWDIFDIPQVTSETWVNNDPPQAYIRHDHNYQGHQPRGYRNHRNNYGNDGYAGYQQGRNQHNQRNGRRGGFIRTDNNNGYHGRAYSPRRNYY